MKDLKKITELRFWCQKVLPLVYDDSLSYYELLCKVVNKLNEIANTVNEFPEYIKELISKEYLEPIMSELLDELREQIARINEHNSSTATGDRKIGTLIWWKDKLYRIVRDMNIGDAYIDYSDNPNIIPVSIEMLIRNVYYPEQELLEINGIIDGEVDIITGDIHTYSPATSSIRIERG